MTKVADDLFKAQYGEDKILWRMFNERPWGFYIEVGAWNGVTLSNTYFLEQMGWTGILVEPLPELYEACVHERPRSRERTRRWPSSSRPSRMSRNRPRELVPGWVNARIFMAFLSGLRR